MGKDWEKEGLVKFSPRTNFESEVGIHESTFYMIKCTILWVLMSGFRDFIQGCHTAQYSETQRIRI